MAPTLSICTSCGAMINDSVREELEVATSSTVLRSEQKVAHLSDISEKRAAIIASSERQTDDNVDAALPSMTARKVNTEPLNSAATSPTLVGFQAKEQTLPDWRLQLQNAVRQRKGIAVAEGSTVAAPTSGAASGAAVARKYKPEPSPLPQLEEDADPRIKAAMERIAASRKAFYNEQTKTLRPTELKRPEPPLRSYPFNVVTPTPSAAAATPNAFSASAAMPARVNTFPKPAASQLVAVTAPEKLDTNRLPKIESIIDPSNEPAADETPLVTDDQQLTGSNEIDHAKRIVIETEQKEDAENAFDEIEEIEDLAPISMRVNATLFDAIIATVATMILLSPVVLAGGSWFTFAGGSLFVCSWAFMSFLYMTASLGFYGRTLGMQLFGLELVDVENNEYPTLRQAAINSSIYIASLFTAGLGFLTVFFNPERRAAHDLVSGTIMIREF